MTKAHHASYTSTQQRLRRTVRRETLQSKLVNFRECSVCIKHRESDIGTITNTYNDIVSYSNAAYCIAT